MPPADLAALAVLCVAALRGLYLGLAREVFSVVSLVAACVAVRFAAAPGGEWLTRVIEADLDPRVAARPANRFTFRAGTGSGSERLPVGSIVRPSMLPNR